jgi:hypothetical protein
VVSQTDDTTDGEVGDDPIEGWRFAMAAELDRRAARAVIRRQLAERRRFGLRRRHAARLARAHLSAH